jgi:hypothetical protein
VAGAFTLEGELTIGQAMPMLSLASASITASVGTSLPELSAKLTGLAALVLQITAAPPTLAASIALTQTSLVALQAAAALPDLSATLLPTLTAQALAIEASIGALELQLAFAASIPLSTGGVLMYAYSGTADGITAAAQSAFASLPGVDPATNVGGVFLIATTPGAKEALDLIFA